MALFPSLDYELSAGESESHKNPRSPAPDVRWGVRLAPREPREKKVFPTHSASKQSKGWDAQTWGSNMIFLVWSNVNF